MATGVVTCDLSDYLGSSDEEDEDTKEIKEKNGNENAGKDNQNTLETGAGHQKMIKFSGTIISSEEDDQEIGKEPNQSDEVNKEDAKDGEDKNTHEPDNRKENQENNENFPVLESEEVVNEVERTEGDKEKTPDDQGQSNSDREEIDQTKDNDVNEERGEDDKPPIINDISEEESTKNAQERADSPNTTKTKNNTVATSVDKSFSLNEEKESESSEQKTIMKAEFMNKEEEENDGNEIKGITQNETIFINDTNEYEESKFGSAHLELHGEQGSTAMALNSQNETLELSIMDNFHVANSGNLGLSLSQLKTPEKSSFRPIKNVASTPILERVPEKSIEEDEEEPPTEREDESTKEIENDSESTKSAVNVEKNDTTEETKKLEKAVNTAIPERYKKYILEDAPDNQFLYFIPEKSTKDKTNKKTKGGKSANQVQTRLRRGSISKTANQVDRSPNQREPRVTITKMSAKNIEDMAKAYGIELTSTLAEDMKLEMKNKLAISHPNHPNTKGELKVRCFIAFRKRTTLREMNELEQQTLAKQLDLPDSYIPEDELRRSTNPEKLKLTWLKMDNEQIDYSNTVNRSHLVTKLNHILSKRYPELETRRYTATGKMDFVILDPKKNYGLKE